MSVKYPDLQSYIDTHYCPEKREDVLPCFSTSSVDSQAAFGSIRFMADAMPAASISREKAEKNRWGGFAPSCKAPAMEKPGGKKKTHGLFFRKTEEKCSALPYCEEAPAESCQEVDENQDYDALLDELKEKLDERQKHLADSFSEYLLHLIAVKQLQNVDVYKAAAVDKKLFAKIKNDPDYHPQKLTCLCLCIGAKCNSDEARDLLSRAGYAFSPSDMRDVIFQYFIEKKIYDIFEIDLQLEEYGVPGIIA